MAEHFNALNSAPPARLNVGLHRLRPVVSPAANTRPDAPEADEPRAQRVFEVDGRFGSSGVWSGVGPLIENAYLDLLALKAEAIVEQHLYELYLVLPAHRSDIRPKYWCLTDTASPGEQTRLYAVDRAYRTVHGLVGLVLQWKRALPANDQWVVLVRNYDLAQHLATRFFAELARRATPSDRIHVVIETANDWSAATLQPHRVEPAPLGPLKIRSKPDPSMTRDTDEPDTARLEQEIADYDETVFEQKYLRLLACYRRNGDHVATARIALRALTLYNRRGYYHEARQFIDTILPCFDQLVGDDERLRMKNIAQLYSTLVSIGDGTEALSLVHELAVPYLSKPDVVANMNYVLGIYYLRYADSKNIELAEHYISLSVANIHMAKDSIEVSDYPFRKAFIDNGLAFLRGRQGRHEEAIRLCQAAFESVTRELGENRHSLHRSVLHYNTAQVFVMSGRRLEGLEYYHKAMRMDPYFSEYYNDTGNILQDLGRYDEAIDDYVIAIRYGCPYPEVYFNKALCHARRGESEDALACFATSLELNPDQPEALALRAELLSGMGRTDEALADYNGAISLGFDTIPARVNRAALYYVQRSYELALSDMNYVVAQDPQEPAHYENRAMIFQAMNRPDLCSHDLSLAERCKQAA